MAGPTSPRYKPASSSMPARKVPKKASSSGLTRSYLIVYNIACFSAWSYILYRLVAHLDKPTSSLCWASLSPGHKAQHAFLTRAKTSYADFGDLTRFVQTGALLEIIHVLAGFVRSGLVTTITQVSSRLAIVWGVLFFFPETQTSPFFTSAVFAWSIAEMVRYATYALGLFDIKLYPLEWLR
ncbi:MAG: hypothetical protein CYPHOPRED_001464 [Cyphobasidiales sp. Tagirdzhanova-0007]|nr:MAG: hypothetical protein CYPHOPRED_001464 [Cyphobasidiales sp. Tagirdzhanova-0007]